MTSSYFQAEDKYTKVVTAAGDAHIKKPIKGALEELDPEAFWQIHRATIVNLRAIGEDRVATGATSRSFCCSDRNESWSVSRTFAHRFKTM